VREAKKTRFGTRDEFVFRAGRKNGGKMYRYEVKKEQEN